MTPKEGEKIHNKGVNSKTAAAFNLAKVSRIQCGKEEAKHEPAFSWVGKAKLEVHKEARVWAEHWR